MVDMGTTEEIIAGMLTENTGRHMLDSGGAYGRAWERNQGRNFAAEPESVVKFDYDYISVVHNVYHWLLECAAYDAELDAEFHAWAEETEERKDTGWLQLMEEWAEQLGEVEDEDGNTREVTGLYGEGSPFVVNTYNNEDLLSQTLQYLYFELDGEPYVLLQVHGGCDVRGGYTAPKVFCVDDGNGVGIFDNARAGISCDGVEPNPNQVEIPGCEVKPCEKRWLTDDANHWYDDGVCGSGAGTQLEDYPRTKEEDGEEWTPGHLHIREDGSMQCPCCGGHLSGGFY